MRKRFEELKKKYQVNVVYLLFFFGVLLIATFLRVQSIPQLKGKYLLGTDAYRFLRQAEYLSEHSRLPERDMMRWLPIGRDLTQQLSLSSYVIAYLYKFCRLFYPSLTVYKAAVYYPIFLYLVTLVVLYLLAKRLLNSATALLTVAILAVSQSTLHRSMAGFSDRDSLSLLLAVSSFYFYIRAVQATGLRSRLIHSSVSGVIMMLLGLTWEGVGLFILVIVLLHAAKLIFDDYTKHDFYPYLCWLGPIVAGLLTLTRTYRGGANYSSPFASIALGIPLLFAMVASIYLSSRRFPAFVDKLTLSHRLPLGVCIVTGLIILISFTVFGLAFFSPDASHWLSAIKNNFLSPLGQSRLMQNVSELTDFSLSLWIQAYRLFFLCLTSLVATIGGFAKVSLEISKSLHPVISSSHPSWKESLDWMKDNLPQDAVIAAEWDYGSHINVLANRATIIDEDHYIPYWIYLFSRHVLCAQTEMEALEFLKTRGTTHLVIGGGDIQKFHKHSYLGADEKLDRHVVPVFLAQISEKDNPPEVHFLLTGHPNVDIEIDGKTYAPYEWYPKRIVLNVKPNPDDNTKELEIEKANIVVSAERKEFELSLEKLSLQGKEIIIESGSFPGGLIVSQIESEQKEDVKKWWAVYLPEVGYNALAIKLYLREIESPHFKLVYSSPNQEDNRINPLPHGVKVWEIIYPPDLEPNPAYLETEFKSKELYRSWMLGKSAVSK